MQRTINRLTLLAVVTGALLAVGRPEAQQQQQPPADRLEISAFAVNMSNVPGQRPPDPQHLALGLEIRYARQTPLPEGGRRIVLAMDRYIGIREARNQPRSIDYPFTLIEIRVDRNGKGEGKMSVATKINFDKKKNVIELENYASEPVRLNNVEVKVKS